MDACLNEVVRYLAAQSWQIAALTAAVALITWMLRGRSAHVRYLLWLIVLAKCLVPPLHAVPLRILPQTVPEQIPSGWSQPAGTGAPAATASPMPLDALGRPRPESAPSPIVSPRRVPRLSVSGWLGVLWLAGAASWLALNVLRASRGHYWLRKTRRPLPGKVQADAADLVASYRVRHLPRIWMMEGVGQPFVWGLVRGSIYVPPGFLTIDSPAHRRDILAHELSHVLRCDAAVNTLQVLAQALFWFHPLVWWVNHKTRCEREKCCDETVIAHLGAKPKDYCTAIVNTLIQAQESTRPVPSLAVAGPVKNIEERIKTMLKPGKKFCKRPSLTASLLITFGALLIVPSALVLTVRAQTERPQARTNSPQTLHQAAETGDLEQVKNLIAQGADVNAKDKRGWTALHEAAFAGHRAVAEVLVAQGADVNARINTGETPLDVALVRGHMTMVKMLTAKGAEVSTIHAAAGMGDVTKVKTLLEQGTDVNAQDGWQRTALHYAARAGAKDVVEILVAKGANVNAGDREDRTAAEYAMEGNYNELVELLISKGADVSPLHWALNRVDLAKAKDLIGNGADLNKRTPSGATPLHLAARAGFVDIAEMLIAKGANVNARDRQDWTPLHSAAQEGHKDLVELLIAEGADVNARDARGWTPLDVGVMRGQRAVMEVLMAKGAEVSTLPVAAAAGDLARVKTLLQQGANVNVWHDQQTALQYAARNGFKEIVKALLANGAEVDARTVWGMTAAEDALVGEHAEIAELLIAKGAADISPLHLSVSTGNLAQVRNLVEKDADVNKRTPSGYSPLILAVHAGRKDIASLLIAKGANVMATDNWGWMPLQEASEKGHRDIVELLIAKGADVNATDMWGYTPLYSAAQNGHKDIVELLITKGADVNTRTGHHTPLWAAKERGDTKIAELLRQHGAKE